MIYQAQISPPLEACFILLHIPRTSGTSLRILFNHAFGVGQCLMNYGGEIEGLSEEQLRRYKLISGHFGFGVHQCLPQTALYLTMLRDPVDRLVSTYIEFLTNPKSKHHALAQSGDINHFVCAGIHSAPGSLREQFHNLQCRMICGKADARVAMEHLEKHFYLACPIHESGTMIEMLRKSLKLPPIEMPHVHESAAKLSPDLRRRIRLSRDSLELLLHFEAQDVQLFADVQQSFARLCAEQGIATRMKKILDEGIASTGTAKLLCKNVRTASPQIIGKVAVAQLREAITQNMVLLNQDIRQVGDGVSQFTLLAQPRPYALQSAIGNACNLCGGTLFGPGPGRRMAVNGRAPLCTQCGSLERHRMQYRILQALPCGVLQDAQVCAIGIELQRSGLRTHCVQLSAVPITDCLRRLTDNRAVFDFVLTSHFLEMMPDEHHAFALLFDSLSEKGVLIHNFAGAKQRAHGQRIDAPVGELQRLYGRDLAQQLRLGEQRFAHILEVRACDPFTGVEDVAHVFLKNASLAREWRQWLGDSDSNCQITADYVA